ncbi:hypothetical protein ONS95_002537 [Cadophora gregata]|uniref:uncharacterized protein n=1 Tax=Cadophora gregata TaxID=51156 RepID=UPI0026DD7A3E|nr:uncharacterized protein ONS95_002537 [Cadophora gregata]KAK0109866.1 hypothetical protein ONS95_002537 [Cadophora gregata]KAK0110507.1 hypothetical protein ONS96_002116 [Cadophora gregata f. sp. sojae]
MSSPALLVILIGMLLSGFVDTQASAQLDTNSVDPSVRIDWCRSQSSACDTLCSSVTNSNDCNSETLTYECQCKNYGTPDLTTYRGTMPTLICLQLFANCKKDAGTSLLKIGKCSTDYYVHCGTKLPVDFEPPATTSSTSTSASHPSSGTATTTRNTSSDSTSSDTRTTSSSSTRPTDTLAISTAPKSSPADIALGAQNTTTPIPANAPQKKGQSDQAIVGIVLGVVAGLTIVVLLALWKLARWRERRDKEKVEAAEDEQRSLRSNRGSVLMMREMSADAIRNHLAKLEAEDAENPKTHAPVNPAELPSHFSRSHSRVFEME